MGDANGALRAEKVWVRVFGGFRCEAHDGGPLPLRSKKAEAALLALVLESPAPVARDKLIDLLWPDFDESRGRASLRQALSVIRSVTGADFFESPQKGWLSLDRRAVACDLWALKDAAVAAGPAPTLTGALLEFAPRPTARFDDWILSREHAIRTELSQLLKAALADTDDDPAFEPGLADALLDLNPADDEVGILIHRRFREIGDAKAAKTVRERVITQVERDWGREEAEAAALRFKPDDEAVPAARARRRARASGASICVTPLENLHPSAADDYFGLAFAEELIVGLSQQRWFRVHAVGLPGDYKPPGVQLGRDEGPQGYRLSGSYAFNGAAMTVRLNLVRAEDGDVVWAEQFHDRRGDLFDVGDDVVRRVTAAVSSEVMSAEATLAVKDRRAETDLDDWTRIMKSRHLFWRTSRSNNAAARALLEPCLGTSPDSIPALTTAAFIRLLDVWSCWSAEPAADLLAAVELSQQAVRAAPRDPWAHFTLGTALGANRQLRDGVDSLTRALTLQSSLLCAVGERGRLRVFLGELDGGDADARMAVELNATDPHVGLSLNTLGLAAFLRGDMVGALDWARRAIAANPYWFHHHMLAAAIRAATGDEPAAKEHLETARRQAPEITLENFERSHPFEDDALAGRYFDPLKSLGLS